MNFAELWRKSDRSPSLLSKNHTYAAGTDETPVFARVDEYLAAEPPRDSAAWDEWQRVKCDVLLGEGRVARTGRGYTVFPACPQVNADILEIAQHYMPFYFNDKGLPPEPVRDLCAHLFLCVETMADGKLSTVFLPQEAAKYLRQLSTHTSVSDRLLETTNQG